MIRHILAEAWNALSHYRLRSVLTMLSIVWGVASLLLLLAYGQGFGEAVIRAWNQTGKDLIVVFPGQTSLQAGGERAGRMIGLGIRDVEALQENVPAIEAISPEVRRYMALSIGHRLRDSSVCGVYASFERIRGMEVERGRFLNENDVLQRRRVVVLGATLKQELFDEQPALGQELKLNGVRFEVIGVLRKKTQITNYATPDDQTAFVPYTALSILVDVRYLNAIVILPVSNVFRSRLMNEIRGTFARLHSFNIRDDRAVEINDWNEYKVIVTNLGRGLNVMLAVIGALTLSIGAVGVMNIMLVAVAERTREIGLLKALGAKRRHILGQILMEALVLTVGGGLVGIFLADVLTRIIGSLPLLGPMFDDPSGRGDIQLGLSLSAILISSLLLIVVGVAAGLVPALRAARLDPVRSMRND